MADDRVPTPRQRRRRRFVVRAVVVVVLVVAAALPLVVALGSSVAVAVDGDVLHTRTYARTVAGVLADLDIAVHRADLVEPALEAPVGHGMVVAIERASTVTVIDGPRTHELTAVVATVAEVLEGLELDLATADVVTPPLEASVQDGAAVTIDRAITVDVRIGDGVARRITAPVATVAQVLRRADLGQLLVADARIEPGGHERVADGDVIQITLPTAVTVTVDGDEVVASTYAPDVAGALDDAGVELADHDLVAPAPGSALVGPTRIVVQRVTFEDDVEEVDLPHGTVRRETDELDKDRTIVEVEGRDGIRLDTYRVRLVDGEESGRELVSAEIIREARDEVVLVGTYVAPPPPPPAPRSSGGSGSSGGTVSSGGSGSSGSSDGGKVIHLTFDDGPNATFTPRILELLARYDAKAVFFTVGRLVPGQAGVAARIANEGHRIGNHSWSHPSLAGVSRERFDSEIGQAQRAVEAATGRRPSCLRPPYGAMDANTRAWAASHGLNVTMWDIDTYDWRRPGTDAIVRAVVANARPGAVVLLHDGPGGRDQTVAALAQILAQLSDQGYRFTVAPGC